MCEMVCYMFREFRWNACCTNDTRTPATVWWNSFCMNQEVRWNSGGKSPARGSASRNSCCWNTTGAPAAGSPVRHPATAAPVEVLLDILLPELRRNTCNRNLQLQDVLSELVLVGTPAQHLSELQELRQGFCSFM